MLGRREGKCSLKEHSREDFFLSRGNDVSDFLVQFVWCSHRDNAAFLYSSSLRNKGGTKESLVSNVCVCVYNFPDNSVINSA